MSNCLTYKAKNNFGQLIKEVYTTGESVIVERAGIPIVSVIPFVGRDFPERKGSDASGNHLQRQESNLVAGKKLDSMTKTALQKK